MKTAPASIIVMGIAGSGKSTLAQALAKSLGWEYLDADDYHPAQNIEKMRRGEPLTDEDRAGWLMALRSRLSEADAAQAPVVLACSALKQVYRDELRIHSDQRPLVFIDISKALAQARLASRQGHFMPASLVDSQLATLERPAHAIVIDATWSVEFSVGRVHEQLGV